MNAEAAKISKGKLKPKAESKSLRDLGLESFTIEEVHRNALIGAPYNPRSITDSEKEKLKKAIARHGVVAPITWNRRTGHIVGGHQRIVILDSLAGTHEYRLQVAAIDVDEAREKEINVLLNNQQAAGDWDFEALRKMFDDPAVTLEGAGFSHADMVNFFGTDVFDNRREDLDAFAKSMSEIGAHYDKVVAANANKAASEFFLVFVFPDGESVEAFRKGAGMPDGRYQNGVGLMDKWGVLPPRK